MTKQEKKNFESLLKHWRKLARAGRKLAAKWEDNGYAASAKTAGIVADVTTVHVKDLARLLGRVQ
jgi:hypothetical protein